MRSSLLTACLYADMFIRRSHRISPLMGVERQIHFCFVLLKEVVSDPSAGSNTGDGEANTEPTASGVIQIPMANA